MVTINQTLIQKIRPQVVMSIFLTWLLCTSLNSTRALSYEQRCRLGKKVFKKVMVHQIVDV